MQSPRAACCRCAPRRHTLCITRVEAVALSVIAALSGSETVDAVASRGLLQVRAGLTRCSTCSCAELWRGGTSAGCVRWVALALAQRLQAIQAWTDVHGTLMRTAGL